MYVRFLEKNRMKENLDDILLEGEKPSDFTEAQIRNRRSWHGRLLMKHPVLGVGILLGSLSIATSGFVYGLVKIAKYLQNNKIEQRIEYKNYLTK